MSQMESLSTIRKGLPKKVCRRKVQLSPAVGSRAALGQFEVLEARHMLTASFSSFQDFNSGPDDYGSAATWGDVDNDGFVDVMINDSMWKNNGGTSFTSLGHPVGRGAFGDYNNDGNLDHISAGPKYVSLGNGLGTFAGSFNLPPTPGSPTEAVTWFDMEMMAPSTCLLPTTVTRWVPGTTPFIAMTAMIRSSTTGRSLVARPIAVV